MLKYIIIGYDSSNFDIEYENIDLINISKIYLLGNEEIENDSVYESVSNKNLLTFYEDMNFEKSDDKIVFIDCRNDSLTYFDTMYSLNTSKFENRSYQIFKGKKLNLKNFEFKENFNPWKGETLPSSLTKEEREYIISMFLNLVIIIKSYLKSDFHLKKISSIPDGWMMNLSTPVLNHICNFYGLTANAVDVPIALDFVHNSQYRQIVCKAIIHITSNFLINNNFVNYIPNQIQDKEKMWFNLETWETLEF